jgi:hypothetical protein
VTVSVATADPRWLNGIEAAALLGVCKSTLRILAARGAVGTREVPGARVVYSRADIEKLLKEAEKPARMPAREGAKLLPRRTRSKASAK